MSGSTAHFFCLPSYFLLVIRRDTHYMYNEAREMVSGFF